MPDVSTDLGAVPIDRYPDICPHCHHALSPLYKVSTLNGAHNIKDTVLDIAFKCTRNNCSRLFISVYKRTAMQGDQMVKEFKFIKSVPLSFLPPETPKEVIDISPSFHKIYSQASAAEATDLDEIAGVGYRKALEYLVKDYCIYKNNDVADKIKSSFLGVVIDDYVDDTNIKTCAKRAAWLGNDETHYVRKWEDKDIKDLKILIQLTSGWVVNNVLTEKYMAEMS